MKDLAQRFGENPILRPQDLRPSVEGMEVTCLLNPGVFRYQGKVWLLVRVAERPAQIPGKTSFPILSPDGRLEVLEFDSSDPRLDLSDPRVISFDGRDYLTTLSHLRLLSSDDGIHFTEPEGSMPFMGSGELETYGIEDCRVAQIGDTYYLTYTQVSSNGVGVGLRITRDWADFDHLGMIFPPHNKDCAIFEEKIGGAPAVRNWAAITSGWPSHLTSRTGVTTAAWPTAARVTGIVLALEPALRRFVPPRAGWRYTTARPKKIATALALCCLISTSPGESLRALRLPSWSRQLLTSWRDSSVRSSSPTVMWSMVTE